MAERAQLHGAVDQRTQTKRDIDALADEVDTFVGEAEIDADIGIKILKREDQPADVQDAERRGAGDADRAGGRAARAPGLIAGLLDQAQDLDAARIIAAAFVGHRDAPRGPAEQRHADGLFEFPEVARDRRLTQSEFARHRRQVAALGDADERAHAFERGVRSIHYSA